MIFCKIEKRFVFAMTLILIGMFGMTGAVFANSYKQNLRNSVKSKSFRLPSKLHKGLSSKVFSNKGVYGKHSNRYKQSTHSSYKSNRYGYQSRGYKKHSYTSPYNSHGYVNKRAYNKYKAPFAGYSHSYQQSKHYHQGQNYQKAKPVVQCYDYKVITHGGSGGFRFQHNIDDFHKIDNRTFVSQICGHDSVEFELSKLDPGVSVSIEIAGKLFHYPAHSGHHKLINNWHRKYFSVTF